MSTIKLLTRFGKNAFYYGQQHANAAHLFYMRPAAAGTMTITCSNYCTQTLDTKSQHWNLMQYTGASPLLHHQYNPLLATTAVRYFSLKKTPDCAGKSESKASSASVTDADIFGDTSKLGLFAKFKLMYKKYWYVLIPVHAVTSVAWFTSFYYLSKSGVDVPALLQNLHISEVIIEKMRNSNMGHFAISYLLYKISTPLRYAVTLGGTTVSIKYLVQAGHIKPMPSKKQFIELYEQKKADRAAAKAEKAAEKYKDDNEK